MILYDIFFRYMTVSLITGILILLLCILSPYINKKYTAKTKYYIWLMIALFLIIPIEIPFWKRPVEVAMTDTVTIYNNTVEENNIIWGGEQGKEAAAIIGARGIESSPIRTPEMFILLWSIGFLVCVCYGMLKYLFYKKYIFRWGKLPSKDTVTATVDALSKEIGIKREVPVVICENVGTPMLVGFLHPCIFLPHEDFDAQDLSIIIRHELTHYKRKDLWYKLLLVMAKAIHWFNPFVYMMYRNASADVERLCDDHLLKGKSYEYRKAYSEMILATIKKGKVNTLSTYFYGGRYAAEERFKNILNTKNRKHGRGLFVLVSICIVCANSLVGCRMNEKIPSHDEESGQIEEIYKNVYEHWQEAKMLIYGALIETGEEVTDERGQIYFVVEEPTYQNLESIRKVLKSTFSAAYIETQLSWVLEGKRPLYKEIAGRLCVGEMDAVGESPADEIVSILNWTEDEIKIEVAAEDADSCEFYEITLVREKGRWVIDQMQEP